LNVNLVTAVSQYSNLTDFLSLQAQYGSKIQLTAPLKIAPAVGDQLVNHETWTGPWKKTTLVSNPAGGAKAGTPWSVPANEIILFQNDGQGGGTTNNGPANPKRDLKIPSNEAAINAPTTIDEWAPVYDEV